LSQVKEFSLVKGPSPTIHETPHNCDIGGPRMSQLGGVTVYFYGRAFACVNYIRFPATPCPYTVFPYV